MHAITKNILYTISMILPLLLPSQGLAAVDSSLKAVLFYPPFCEECSAVIDDFLMPLSISEHERLEIFPVDITEPPGDHIYQEIRQRFRIGLDAMGRPALLIGDQLLLGKTEINDGLSRILTQDPTEAATNWPEHTDLRQLIKGEPFVDNQQTAQGNDTTAKVFASAVMLGMLLALGYATFRLMKRGLKLADCLPVRSWALPLFGLVGLGIGVYLTSVRLTNNQAMCGPIGDCMRVQNSPHSIMFGIPMSVWGLGFYLIILTLWGTQRYATGQIRRLSAQGLILVSLFGVVFSIYLTALELFVIHAVCIWCLSSAVLATLIMLTVVFKTSCTEACGAE